MAFTADLPVAARRHLDAADKLYDSRRDVAGYLYGIAAECAIKAMMLKAPVRMDDAFYAHFPELRTILRNAVQGRAARTLAAFINDDAFMNNWHVSMRYASARQIPDGWVMSWREQARRVVNSMGA